MKIKLATLLILALTATACKPDNNAPAHNIATWKNYAKAAITYTWDDCTPNQLPVAKPLFDKHYFKATFFVTTDWVKDWHGFQNAANEGFEVACHTKSHPNFSELTEAQRAEELGGAQDTINHYVKGHQCRTFAYPYCAVGTDAQTESYFISARTCDGHVEGSTPKNLHQVSSISCGSEGHIKTVDDFKKRIIKAENTEGWAVFLLHGIDGDGGYSPIESEILDGHLTYMGERRKDFWVTTYFEAVRYIRARDAAKFTFISNKEDELLFSLKHELDPLYNIFLSLEVEIPSEWKAAQVMQGKNGFRSTIVEREGTKYLRFHAFLNRDAIRIFEKKG